MYELRQGSEELQLQESEAHFAHWERRGPRERLTNSEQFTERIEELDEVQYQPCRDSGD